MEKIETISDINKVKNDCVMKSLSQSQYKELIVKSVPELISLHGLIFYGKSSGQIPKERLDELRKLVENICSELDNRRPLNLNNGLPIDSDRSIKMMKGIIKENSAKNSPYVKKLISQGVAKELGEEPNGELIDKAVEKFYVQENRFFRNIFTEVMDIHSYIYYGI